MLLCERIKLMIVAASALNRDTAERVERSGDHIIAVQIAGHLAVDFGFRHFDVSDEVPWSSGDKTESQDSIGLTGKQRIAGNLFLHETSVRFVVVERADHVIAVRPGIGTQFVFIIAAGVGVADDVQPVASPTFSILRRTEQSIDKFFVSVG